MKIARYWIKGSARALSEAGAPITVTAWGWSALNREEAKQRAEEAAQRAARRLQASEPFPHSYSYHDRPPREEITREIEDAEGNMLAVITRNTYGSLVLNTSDLMFIDIDIPAESEGARLLRTIKSFFGIAVDTPESLIQKRVAALAHQYSDLTFRLYRTFAGFRCAVTNRPISPHSAESTRLLETFGADPLYVTLCRNQQSYRARLTPKYWRCGAQRPPNRFPWATPTDEQRYRIWEQEYTELSRDYAVCQFIEQFGMQEGRAESRMLVNLHDELTGAHTGLALA